MENTPTTPEKETAVGGEQSGEVQQQAGEEGEGSEELYPLPSDAADSHDRGTYGDSRIPGAFGAGDLTRRGVGNNVWIQVERYDEERRQQEQQEGARGDVEMENVELLEASTTPTSLQEPNSSLEDRD